MVSKISKNTYKKKFVIGRSFKALHGCQGKSVLVSGSIGKVLPPDDQEAYDEEQEKLRKYGEILDNLNIPHFNGLVTTYNLVDILIDEEKFKELKSRLALKAFW